MSGRNTEDTVAVDADVVEMRASHERLLQTVQQLGDAAMAAGSLLPGWDVAMVLTHLARHADSQSAVLRGQAMSRYTSIEARDAGIEAGRGATADTVVADLRRAIDALDAAYRDADWTGAGERLPGIDREPFIGYPFQRWREVEVHHADLGVGYTPDDWPETLATRWLPEVLASLPDRSNGRRLLAWALGRAAEAPPLDPWR